MAYSEKALALRRCTEMRKDGQPCRAWAVWDDPDQRCTSHSGRHHTGPMPDPDDRVSSWATVRYTSPASLCRCEAYAWPHRRAGGLCCWPDPPRFGTSDVKLGTHSARYWRARRARGRR